MDILNLINQELDQMASLGTTPEDQEFVDYLRELAPSLPIDNDDC